MLTTALQLLLGLLGDFYEIWSMLMHYKRKSDKPFADNDPEWNSIFILYTIRSAANAGCGMDGKCRIDNQTQTNMLSMCIFLYILEGFLILCLPFCHWLMSASVIISTVPIYGIFCNWIYSSFIITFSIVTLLPWYLFIIQYVISTLLTMNKINNIS